MKVNVTIPESLSEIKLGSWQRFSKIESPDALDVLECFAGVARENSRKLNYKQVEKISTDILKIFEIDQGGFQTKFTLNGKKFGFVTNMDSLTYGEFEDLTTYSASHDTLHRTMAVLYRPITFENSKVYDIESYEGTDKYANDMLDVPLDIAFGSSVFFYSLLNDLLSDTQTYIEKEVMNKMMQDYQLSQHSLLTGEATTNYSC